MVFFSPPSLFVCVYICVYVYLFVYLCVYLSVCLPVYHYHYYYYCLLTLVTLLFVVALETQFSTLEHQVLTLGARVTLATGCHIVAATIGAVACGI